VDKAKVGEMNHDSLKRRTLLGLGWLAFSAGPARAQTQTAAAFLEHERDLARAEGKGVMLIYFASWCQWCRLLDRALADPAALAVVGSRFRIVHMRTLERREEMRAQQLEGADDLFRSMGGNASRGLPLFFFLDSEGAVLASSISPNSGVNIGFPVTDEELDALDTIFARAAPNSTVAERAQLRAACTRNAPGKSRP
jgi:hypothetical protein